MAHFENSLGQWQSSRGTLNRAVVRRGRLVGCGTRTFNKEWLRSVSGPYLFTIRRPSSVNCRNISITLKTPATGSMSVIA
jgi:hypothetical protein